MGGSTDKTSTTSGSQQSSQQPWAPTQPDLSQIIAQLGPALNNTGTSPGENSALQSLISNATGAPNFGSQAYNTAGDLLTGSNTVNPNGTVGQAYGAMQSQYAPYTDPN